MTTFLSVNRFVYKSLTCQRNVLPLIINQRWINITAVDLAARKGTREKARKKKVKVEIKKVEFVPGQHKLKKLLKLRKNIDLHANDDHKGESIDDVYFMTNYKTKTFSFTEAIQIIHETHHSSIYNMPDALVTAEIELFMQGEKKTRIKENISGISLVPHQFSEDVNRTILVFCKDSDLQQDIIKAGASNVGGLDIIKQIQTGGLKIHEYQYILAHPQIVIDLLPIRGILKKKFPQLVRGTVNNDIVGLVKKYLNGVEYISNKDEIQKTFGSVEINIGKLNMEVSQLEENFDTILKDIDSFRPKRAGLFITRCYIKSEPSIEKFKLDPFVYVSPERKIAPRKVTPETIDINYDVVDSDSDEEEDTKVQAKS